MLVMQQQLVFSNNILSESQQHNHCLDVEIYSNNEALQMIHCVALSKLLNFAFQFPWL